MLFELVGHPFPFFRVCGGGLFGRDIGPSLSIFGVDPEPFFDPRFGIGLDRFNRAFRLAYAAVDALVRVDDQHVLALVETIDGANLDAVHVFAFDAIVVDDVGHFRTLRRFFEALLLSHGSRPRKERRFAVVRPAGLHPSSGKSAAARGAAPRLSTKPITLRTRTPRSSATVMTSPARIMRPGALMRAPLTRT